MTRVDFYLLKGNTFSDQIDFCCRLTEKAFSLHPRIHIQTTESAQSEALNSALWSFKEDSFLPHCIGHEHKEPTPITIDSKLPLSSLSSKQDLLISLANTIPEKVDHYQRLCLIILNIEVDIQEARKRYKELKQLGFEVHIHDMR